MTVRRAPVTGRRRRRQLDGQFTPASSFRALVDSRRFWRILGQPLRALRGLPFVIGIAGCLDGAFDAGSFRGDCFRFCPSSRPNAPGMPGLLDDFRGFDLAGGRCHFSHILPRTILARHFTHIFITARLNACAGAHFCRRRADELRRRASRS